MAAYDFDSLLLLIDSELDGYPIEIMTRQAKLLHAARVNIRAFMASNPPDGEPPPFARAILAAIEELRQTMADTQSATAAALAKLQADVTAEQTVLASATALIQGFPATVSAAVSEALTNAGVDDETQATALAAIDASLQSSVDGLQAAIAANTPPTSDTPPASPPPNFEITPTSLSGVVGQPLTGQFTAPGATGSLTWSVQDAPPDVFVGADGTISGTPEAVSAGDMTVSFVSGVASEAGQLSVPYTITAAPPA